MKKERLNRGSYTVASSVANLIYKPLVLEPGVLILVGSFQHDGKQVVSGSGDGTVRLWDAATGAALQTLEGHTDWVTSVAFSPDGKQVVSGSGDRTVRLWDAATGAALRAPKRT
jgi:WD40 repeat protein